MLKKIKERFFSSEYTPLAGSAKATADRFTMLALIFGVLFILLNPPFTCPDEIAHYLNTMRIASGNIFPDVQDGQIGSVITADQMNFIYAYNNRYNGLAAERFNFAESYFQSYLSFTSDEGMFFPTILSNANPFAFTFTAAGAAFGRIFFHNNSPYNAVIWGKIFNLLFYTAMTRTALLRTPVLRNTMMLIALMPMTIYQCSSLSYDTMAISAAFLLFASSAKIVCADSDYRIDFGDIAAVCISCAFLFASKIAYAPLVIVLLAVNIKKFGSLKKYFLCIGAVAMTAVVFYLIPTFIISRMYSQCSNVTTDIVIAQKQYLRENPSIFPGVIFCTIKENYHFWINGFFGILGSLDTNFPQPFIQIYLLLLLLTGIIEACMSKGINIGYRLLSAAAIAIFLTGTVYAMYTDWTPQVNGQIGGYYATGIQGRYFIPISLYGVVIFASPLLSKFRYRAETEAVIEKISRTLPAIYMVLMTAVLLLRFWI